MTKVLLTIRIEEDIKKQLKIFSEDLGLNMSRTVTILLKQAVRDQRIFLTTRARGSYLTEPIVEIDVRN